MYQRSRCAVSSQPHKGINDHCGPTVTAACNSSSCTEYDTHWPDWFEQIRGHLWPAVWKFATAIEHVGSTSVPGLAAKPGIDIDIIIPGLAGIPLVIHALKGLGYLNRDDLGISGREAFQ
ncbi:MAG: GrpB family protein [Chloroflexota bacterium]